jgi:hypothetical protein
MARYRDIALPLPKDVTEGWRKLHNVELYNCYSSKNIRTIKSTRMMWAGHAARMGT